MKKNHTSTFITLAACVAAIALLFVLDLVLPIVGCDAALADINRRLITGGIALYTVSKKENRKLEDVFIELTGEGGGQIA